MKSVEFLISLALIISVYAFLYKDAMGLKTSVDSALSDFNRTVHFSFDRSLVRSLMAYGEPFEAEGIEISREVPEAVCNLLTDTCYYVTYSRW